MENEFLSAVEAVLAAADPIESCADALTELERDCLTAAAAAYTAWCRARTMRLMLASAD